MPEMQKYEAAGWHQLMLKMAYTPVISLCSVFKLFLKQKS